VAAIAIVSCDELLAGHADNELLANVLEWRGHTVEVRSWRDRAVAWDQFAVCVLRTTWDYSAHYEEFLGWLRGFPGRLLNPPDLVAWNSDKHYLADLAAAGVPVVPTRFIPPGAPAPALAGEVVVKPSVSAGARLTGRFSAPAHDQARVLLAAIAAVGRTAMVQPYLNLVDTAGETDVVLIDGVYSHALHKRAVLHPDEVAPAVPGGGPAQVMLAPDLVRPTAPTPVQLELAERVRHVLAARFGQPPLILRVDLVDRIDGPVVLEVEAVEPNLSFDLVPQAAALLADAIEDRL
jgi:glutathione synthase/RimK-type ligase-like ATP-grasp enzyme